MKENLFVRTLLRIYFLGLTSLFFIYPLYMLWVEKMIFADPTWVPVSKEDIWLSWIYTLAIVAFSGLFFFIIWYATRNENISKLRNIFIISVLVMGALIVGWIFGYGGIVVNVLMAIFLIYSGFEGMITGKTPATYGGDIRRSSSPFLFWIAISMYSLVGFGMLIYSIILFLKKCGSIQN